MNGFEKCQMEILVRLLRFANDFYSKAEHCVLSTNTHTSLNEKRV